LKLNTKRDLNLFFQTHYSKAVQKAIRIVNELELAEDISQECIIKLWEQRDRLVGDNVEAFYFTMVRNRSIDYIRKKKLNLVKTDLSHIQSETSDPIEYQELAERVHAIIDSLPERCRQIFVLSRFEEMSYKEISKQLDISPRTVENQVSKALRILRSGLDHLLHIIL